MMMNKVCYVMILPNNTQNNTIDLTQNWLINEQIRLLRNSVNIRKIVLNNIK